MKIVLIGGNFKNKGAEAMILTALREFSRRWSNPEIVVASYASRDTRPFGMHEVEVGGTTCRFRFIKNRKDFLTALQLLVCLIVWSKGLRKKLLSNNLYLSEVLSADMVVDISGFAMTDKRPLHRRIVYCAEILTAQLLGIPFVIFTQALGPFKQFSTRILAKLCLSRAKLVCARGTSTVDFLNDLGVGGKTRVIRCADSAYLFPVGSDNSGGELLRTITPDSRPIVGIVTNSNIVERTALADGTNAYIALLAATVDRIVERLGARVVFICHELYEGRKDDRWVAEQVIAKSRHGVDVSLVTGDHTAAELKQAIAGVDFLIASRFHALVAANSLGVPSIAIAWAHKYHELFSEAGVPELVFDAEDLDPKSFFERLDKAWARRSEISATLAGRHDALVDSASSAFDAVAELLALKQVA
jgi:polysaccharide pyruvyl transferase WcaK-like protein